MRSLKDPIFNVLRLEFLSEDKINCCVILLRTLKKLFLLRNKRLDDKLFTLSHVMEKQTNKKP